MKYKVGDKVIPHSKTVGDMDFKNESNWKSARMEGQGFLYVNAINGNPNIKVTHYECGRIREDGYGNFYGESDLTPYPATLSTGDTIKAYELMKLAAENPQKHSGKKYKSEYEEVVDVDGNRHSEVYFGTDGDLRCRKNGYRAFIGATTILEEIPQTVSFMEAANSGNEIRHELWTDYYTLSEALTLIADTSSSQARAWINGKWFVEE
jgi:hypothetical protein